MHNHLEFQCENNQNTQDLEASINKNGMKLGNEVFIGTIGLMLIVLKKERK
jgi:hypothetical protein